MSDKDRKVDEGTRKRLEEMDLYYMARQLGAIAEGWEGGCLIDNSPAGRLRHVAACLGFSITFKEAGTLEAEKSELEKEFERRRNAPPRRPIPFDDVIAEVCNFDYEEAFGLARNGDAFHGDAFPGWLDHEVAEVRSKQEKLCEEIKGALSSDVEAGVRADLLERLADAFSDAMFIATEKPYVSYGVVIGMRLCGLSPAEIKARMAWLL